MAKSRAELLQEIADSTPSGGGNNLRDGRYRFIVRKTSLENGFNGPRWGIDLVVKNAAKVAVVELKTGKAIDVEPNAVGTDVGIVKMLTGKGNYPAPGLGDTKAFVLTLFDADPTTSQAELVATLDELDKTNSAYGMAIDCSTRRKVSKENEVEMVLQDWSYVAQTPDEIKANRKWVEDLVTAPPPAPALPAGTPAAATAALGPPGAPKPKALAPPMGPPAA
jgi:hypothetical protein